MENQKQVDFISKVRQLSTQYRNLIGELDEMSNQWNALYGSLVAEADFESGNMAVIPNPTRLQSLTDVIGNMQTIVSTFDAGIDTNFERVTA